MVFFILICCKKWMSKVKIISNLRCRTNCNKRITSFKLKYMHTFTIIKLLTIYIYLTAIFNIHLLWISYANFIATCLDPQSRLVNLLKWEVCSRFNPKIFELFWIQFNPFNHWINLVRACVVCYLNMGQCRHTLGSRLKF